MRRNSALVAFIALLAMISLYCSCRSANRGAVTLTLLSTETDPASKRLIESVVTDFRRAHANVEVRTEFLGWEAMYPRVIAGIASGNPPDLMGISTDEVVAFAARGQLEPVTDVMTEVGNDWIESGRIRLSGDDWYVPYALTVLSLYYRSDLVAGAGIEIPTRWDEFLRFCQALTVDTNSDGRIDRYGTAIPLGLGQATANFFLSQLFSANGHVFDSNDEVVIDKSPNREAAVRTLNFIRDLARFSPKGSLSYEWKDLTQVYYSRSVASTYYAGRVFTLVREYAPELDTLTESTAYPFDQSARPCLFGDGWAIAKGCKSKELAKELIKRLVTGVDYIDFLHSIPIHLTPPRYSILSDSSYLRDPVIERHGNTLKLVKELLPQCVNFAMEHGHINPYAGEVMKSQILEEMVQSVVAEKNSADAAVTVAGTRIRLLVQDLRERTGSSSKSDPRN